MEAHTVRVVYRPGTAFAGGGGRYVHGDDASGAIRALDATTGKKYVAITAGFTLFVFGL